MAAEGLAGWWNEQDSASVGWRVTRQAVACPQCWPRVQCVYSWVRALAASSVSLWLVRHLTPQLAVAGWAWLYLLITLPIAVDDGRRVLSGLLCTSAEVRTIPSESQVEVTIDLEPILAEMEDFAPASEVYTTAREALTAKFERVRAECFQHPVGQALMEQIDACFQLQKQTPRFNK